MGLGSQGVWAQKHWCSLAVPLGKLFTHLSFPISTKDNNSTHPSGLWGLKQVNIRKSLLVLTSPILGHCIRICYINKLICSRSILLTHQAWHLPCCVQTRFLSCKVLWGQGLWLRHFSVCWFPEKCSVHSRLASRKRCRERNNMWWRRRTPRTEPYSRGRPACLTLPMPASMTSQKAGSKGRAFGF